MRKSACFTADCNSQYWILRGRELVKKTIKGWKFVVRRLAFQIQRNIRFTRGKKRRLSTFYPYISGFHGPINLQRIVGENSYSKFYICLFTCSATRAIHLQFVKLLDLQSFISAFRRSTGRRGMPSSIWRDNATTYVKKLWKSSNLFEFLAKNSVKWKFIVDRCPWQGRNWA